MKTITNLSLSYRIALITLGLIVVCGIGILGIWGYSWYRTGETIYPNTYIDDIDMGGKSREEALKMLQRRDDYFADAMIEVVYKDIKIATFSGEQLHLERDIDSKVDQAYLIGRSSDLSSRVVQQLNGVLGLRKYTFHTGIRYDEKPIRDFLEVSRETYEYPAIDALFTFENGKVTKFKSHKDGRRLRTDEFLQAMNQAIQEVRDHGAFKVVNIQDEIVPPEITLSEANDLGIEELIGQGKSDYTHSIPSRVHNVILAASKFNGVIVPKGTVFSFNKYIGDISSSTGYQPAYVIKNGRTVLGDGGGVCQVSTTIFRAALNTGLPIVERHAHAYRVSYYENDSEPGFDATIYSPSVDLRFENNSPGAILIETVIDKENRILTFNFYGQSDGRRVELSPVTVWGVVPPPEALYEDDPTLPQGVVKQVDYAAWGAKARFEYKVFDAQNNVTINDAFVSSFRPWQAVYLRGTGGV